MFNFCACTNIKRRSIHTFEYQQISKLSEYSLQPCFSVIRVLCTCIYMYMYVCIVCDYLCSVILRCLFNDTHIYMYVDDSVYSIKPCCLFNDMYIYVLYVIPYVLLNRKWISISCILEYALPIRPIDTLLYAV